SKNGYTLAWQRQSLMPELLLRDMTAQQVADLPASRCILKCPMNKLGEITRRDWLAGATTAALGTRFAQPVAAAEPTKPKAVAAVITAYQKGLHADVLLGKILEGWEQDGRRGPALTLASMYVDQFPAGDLARPMAKKHNVPIFDTIEKA